MVKIASWVAGVMWGAVLATPFWHSHWTQWQAHRARQSVLEELTSEVQALRQRIAAETAREAASQAAEVSAPVLTSQTLLASVQDVFVAQGLQVLHAQVGMPFTLQGTDAWLCPLQVQWRGAASLWRKAWQHMRVQHPGVVIERLHWQAMSDDTSGNTWQAQLVVPCVVPKAQESSESSHEPKTQDPFSAAQWQALHDQQLQQHPDAGAIQRHWAEPASPLTRVPLEHWRYVGFMHNAERQVALLTFTPAAPTQAMPHEASVHVVQVGQSVGTHWGEVTHIDPTAVTVQEWLRDASGVWRRQRTLIPLHKSTEVHAPKMPKDKTNPS